MLCISTSHRVLGTPFAGRNRLSDAKTIFSVTNGTKNALFYTFMTLKYAKSYYSIKNWFQPANSMRSTHSLVKIHNKNKFKATSLLASFNLFEFKNVCMLKMFTTYAKSCVKMCYTITQFTRGQNYTVQDDW